MFNRVFFFENSAIYEIMSKTVWRQRCHKWRHNVAHTSCMLDKLRYIHPRTRRRTCKTHALGITHARACTRTHKKYVRFIAFPRQQWFANASQCYVIHIFLSFYYLSCHTSLQMLNITFARISARIDTPDRVMSHNFKGPVASANGLTGIKTRFWNVSLFSIAAEYTWDLKRFATVKNVKNWVCANMGVLRRRKVFADIQKVKSTVEHAMKAQRGRRDIAELFL